MKVTSRYFSYLLLVTLVSSCTDAAGRFAEFGENVIDAAQIVVPDAQELEELPDVTGRFLSGISPVVLPEAIIKFDTALVLTKNDDGTGLLDVTFTPLSVADGTPVGTPLVSNGAVVSNAGEVSVPVAGVIPGAANPISGTEIRLDAAAVVVLRSADLLCGDVTGRVSQPTPLDLTGSTIAVIRIASDLAYADFPEALFECPDDVPVVDAGVPDAS